MNVVLQSPFNSYTFFIEALEVHDLRKVNSPPLDKPLIGRLSERLVSRRRRTSRNHTRNEIRILIESDNYCKSVSVDFHRLRDNATAVEATSAG